MCGFLIYKGTKIAQEILIKSHLFQKSRGLDRDDCQNYIYNSEFFISHNTLPLVNSNPDTYHQPVKITDKSYYVFAGEIFNFKELNNNFEIDTHFIHSKIDLNNLENLNLEEFDGFWSYGYVDNDQIFGMTDFLSQKPLYYRTDIQALASEPETLSLLNSCTVDETFYSNVLKWGYSPDGRTQWSEIKQLPAGHYYHNGIIKEYWNWDKVKAISKNNLIDSLKKSIDNRLHSIEKISFLLSGGLDSSLIYSLLPKNIEVKTYHVENDESEFVLMMDDKIEILNLDEIPSLEEANKIHQSPVDLGSLIPQIQLAKAISNKGYNIVLTGDGADELFGGYRRAKEYDSQYSDIFCELVYYHLPKLDRVNMNYTIETRSPFLSPELIKYALSLKWIERTEKEELKRIAIDIVPDRIINRTKKPLKTNSIIDSPLKNRKKMIQESRKN
jgi:asparagine synthetase B (glutamine-hydrolysing)